MTERRPLYAVHGRNDLDYDGWLIETFGIGHDPNHQGGADLRGRQIPIARLNDGYPPNIPQPQYYSAFAQRVANFVRASQGCSRWIIGNEPNHAQERPDGQPITPANYALCYSKCRDAIHALESHEQDEVLIAAVAPWNNQTAYPGNEAGNWVRYFQDVQSSITGCDGFAIHTYAREQTTGSIVADDRMGPPFEAYHNGFKTYQDWMNAILPQYRGLPVYCTEFCIAGVPWQNADTGCIRQAYQEIFTWNGLYPERPILALAVYRWQYDQWTIKDKPAVLADFMEAVACGYTYPDILDPGEPPDACLWDEQRITQIEARLDEIERRMGAAGHDLIGEM